MAGDWIKMRSELQSHPKVVRILSAMRRHDVQNVTDKFRVVGGLHAVWSVFDTHSTDGTLTGYTPDLLDHVIGLPGFAEAMIAVQWLAFDGDQILTLPEFDEHNSKGAKRRAEDQKRKRNDRKAAELAEKLRTESGQAAEEKLTRERERVREEEARAKASLTPAGAHDDDRPALIVTDGDGNPIAQRSTDDAVVLGSGVAAAKVLRDIGIRVTALDPTLLGLCHAKFSVEAMALVAAELVLRKAGLFDNADGSLHPDLQELLASGALIKSPQSLALTPEQLAAVRTAAADVPIAYISKTLTGRRDDAAAAQSPRKKHGTATHKVLGGTGSRGSAVERVRANAIAAEQRDREHSTGTGEAAGDV